MNVMRAENHKGAIKKLFTMDPDLAAKYPEWHKELMKLNYGLRSIPTSSFDHVCYVMGVGTDLDSEECGWTQGFNRAMSIMETVDGETLGLRMALSVEYLYDESDGCVDMWKLFLTYMFCATPIRSKTIPAVIRQRGLLYDIIELTDSRLEYITNDIDGAVALLLEYDRTKLDKFACLSEASDMCQMFGLHASNLPLTDPIMVYHDLRSSS